jgi:ABC-type uncharacterized transport system substrate-binding protein
MTRTLRGMLVRAVLCAAYAMPAAAHPHIWITVETTVIHDHGAFVGLAHKWTFDELYTAMAIEGLDKNNDGKYDREELAELAKVNIEGLKDFSYFTFPALAGHELGLGEVRDYWAEHQDGILSLHFTVPFAQPVLVDAKGLTFSMHDPTFFIAFELAKTDAVRFSEGTPKACKIGIGTPDKDPSSASALGEATSPQLGAFAVGFVKTIAVDCGGS